MRKLFGAVIALALTTVVLTGCRGNVSNDENGRITDPTMMPETIATMPSTDTTPSIMPEPTVTTHPTQDTTRPSMDETLDNGTSGDENGIGGSSDSSGTAGMESKARPNRSMG